MKFIGKLLISLLLILLLLIVLIYMLLQTTWGAGWLGRQLTRHSDYQVSFGNINHSWTQFSEIQLDNVSLGKKRRAADAGRQTGSGRAWHTTTHRSLACCRLQLQDDTLNLDSAAPAWPLQADTLQLNGMAVRAPAASGDSTARMSTPASRPGGPRPVIRWAGRRVFSLAPVF